MSQQETLWGGVGKEAFSCFYYTGTARDQHNFEVFSLRGKTRLSWPPSCKRIAYSRRSRKFGAAQRKLRCEPIIKE